MSTLYHTWKALEEIHSGLSKADILALSNPYSHIVDEPSALAPSHISSADIPGLHGDEALLDSSANPDLGSCHVPMDTGVSDPQAANENKKKEARRRKKWKQSEKKVDQELRNRRSRITG